MLSLDIVSIVILIVYITMTLSKVNHPRELIVSRDSRTWMEADKACTDNNQRLISFINKENVGDLNTLFTMMNGEGLLMNSSVWTGLRLHDGEESFMWDNCNKSGVDLPWATGHPRQLQNNTCVALHWSTLTLQTFQCLINYQFICEIPHDSCWIEPFPFHRPVSGTPQIARGSLTYTECEEDCINTAIGSMSCVFFQMVGEVCSISISSDSYINSQPPLVIVAAYDVVYVKRCLAYTSMKYNITLITWTALPGREPCTTTLPSESTILTSSSSLDETFSTPLFAFSTNPIAASTGMPTESGFQSLMETTDISVGSRDSWILTSSTGSPHHGIGDTPYSIYESVASTVYLDPESSTILSVPTLNSHQKTSNINGPVSTMIASPNTVTVHEKTTNLNDLVDLDSASITTTSIDLEDLESASTTSITSTVSIVSSISVQIYSDSIASTISINSDISHRNSQKYSDLTITSITSAFTTGSNKATSNRNGGGLLQPQEASVSSTVYPSIESLLPDTYSAKGTSVLSIPTSLLTIFESTSSAVTNVVISSASSVLSTDSSVNNTAITSLILPTTTSGDLRTVINDKSPVLALCPCVCIGNGSGSYGVQEKELKEILKKLFVDKSTLSSTRRKLTSAEDHRTSAIITGRFGMVVLVGVFCFMLLLDSQRVIMAILDFKRSKTVTRPAIL